MNKILTYLCSSRSNILRLSLTVLAALSLTPRTLAGPVSPSHKQLVNGSKFLVAKLPTPRSITSNSSNSTLVDIIKAQGASERSLSIQELRGTATIGGRSAKVGDRLLVSGDELVTGNDSIVTLVIDNNSGIVEVAENTAVKIETLSADAANPVTAIFVSKGRVRLSITSSASKSSSSRALNGVSETRVAGLNNLTGIGQIDEVAQAANSAKNAPVRVRTPRGVAGVRGTSFGVNVGPDGKTGVDTIGGAVGFSGIQQEVTVNAGYWSVINFGGEPTVTKENPALSILRIRSLSRISSRTFRLFGQVQPMDLVYVNGEAIATDAEGKFRIEGDLPLSRRLKVTVRGPSVRERVYELAVP
ncbi:MAG TPA: hypothetical protein VK211_10305 [Kamptonema sp.]|nr:hypothetical protein [Kamptonema sp.]